MRRSCLPVVIRTGSPTSLSGMRCRAVSACTAVIPGMTSKVKSTSRPTASRMRNVLSYSDGSPQARKAADAVRT